jgi:hypothetical protein
VCPSASWSVSFSAAYTGIVSVIVLTSVPKKKHIACIAKVATWLILVPNNG